MTLLAGRRLDTKIKFFSKGVPVQCGSSYDLTVGQIIDEDGKNVEGPFRLEPGHMVQLVTEQVFQLPKTVTGHVTCKTTLTQKGVWALTVGIVDPGWDGQIATTLLNFGKNDHIVQVGDPFLRVSLFEHCEVDSKHTRQKPEVVDGYINLIRKNAAKNFPRTFLDAEKISETAGRTAIKKLRNQSMVWVPVFAIAFALLQIFISFAPSWIPGWAGASLEQVHEVQSEIVKLKLQIKQLEDRL